MSQTLLNKEVIRIMKKEGEYVARMNCLPIGTVLCLSDHGIIVQKKYVRYKEGAALFSVSQSTFEQWAKEAGAIVKKEKAVLVNLEILDKYLDQFRLPPI
jgi:hypothetical protein